MKQVQRALRKKVVIADDDAFIRESLKKILEGTEYEVTAEVANGLELLKQCDGIVYDIAIVDIEMPGMDGISAAGMLLEEKKIKCVVILTSFDSLDYISDTIKAGVAGYLTKPIDRDMLLPTLHNALEKSNEWYEKNKDLNRLIGKKEVQKYIDQAKLCLMAERSYSEEEAYQYMKDISKYRQISLEHVAKIIISKRGKI